MNRFVLMLAILASVALTACGDNFGGSNKLGFDEGYSDGYAEGYNTTCDIRATLVHGEWENADYSRGYNSGRQAGSFQCLEDRKRGRVKK